MTAHSHSGAAARSQTPQSHAPYGLWRSRLEAGIMNSSRTHTTENANGWTKAARGPWTVICAVATVVLGPAAVTASALDQANAAPLYHAVKADQTQAYIPSDISRRRAAA
jgi:hypothetical protein